MLNLPPLYPITDARLDRSLSAQVRRFGEAGFPLVQFRGKPLPDDVQMAELRAALQASAGNGGWPRVVVNDRADLALLAAAEGLPPWGLHLGQADLPPSEAARLPGLAALHLGTSTHQASEWAAVDAACDHAGVGPVRGTATKSDHSSPIGFDGLATGCAALRAQGLAPVAIGGLGPGDLDACFAAGAESVAMVGALAASEDPAGLLWKAQAARWKARPIPLPGRSVVLAGSSGAGKSTLGAMLAARLGLPFHDLDDVLEARAGASIPAIFAARGEAAFRALESELLPGLLASPSVVALGGGAWETEAVRRAAQDAGAAVLWLAERPEACWARVAADPHRPLARDRGTFLARHRARMARWSLLPCVLPLGRGPEEIVDGLLAGVC
ncbi:MAG: shikimate kinase [Holophagaceae bacterium]